MKPEELLEKVEVTLDELRSLNKELPIIVEGTSDVRTLRQLGVEGKIIHLNKGQSIFNFCEEIARNYDEIIILTDWDRTGGHLCRLLREGLKANDVKYNIKIRAQLAGYCKKETKDVAGLAGCINRLKKG